MTLLDFYDIIKVMSKKKYKYIIIKKDERLALNLALTVLITIRNGDSLSQFKGDPSFTQTTEIIQNLLDRSRHILEK